MGDLDGLTHAGPLLSLLPLFSYHHVGGLYFCLYTIYFLLMAHGYYCISLCYLNLGQKDLHKTRGESDFSLQYQVNQQCLCTYNHDLSAQ